MHQPSSDTPDLNLTTHRAPESVWERRGWDGAPEPAVTRWLIGVGGGALAIEGLRRRGAAGGVYAALGGGLAWWALTGECDLSRARSWFQQILEHAPWHHRDDLVGTASEESFPASDAPSWTPTVGTVASQRPREGRPR